MLWLISFIQFLLSTQIISHSHHRGSINSINFLSFVKYNHSVNNTHFLSLGDVFRPSLQTIVVTNSSYGHIHRFFDSVPLSPNNRYISVTRIFNNETKLPLIRDEIDVDSHAEIVIIDLINGSEIVIDKTLAWDSQLGSQLQWSNQDNIVYYNTFNENYHVQGVMYDINRNVKQDLTCPIYHVSYSGKYSIRYQSSPTYYPTILMFLLVLVRI